MRIVGGSLKGRAIATPSGQTTRPTSDRARESIFNMLAHASWAVPLDGARVLDLFSGSGALGFEAVSRGAAFALFVETNAAARGVIRDNIETFALFGVTRIHRRDATDLGVKPAGLAAPFDLVFLDPPYGKGLGERALGKLMAGGWITPDATIVFECGADETPVTTGFTVEDTRVWGAAKVLFLSPAA